MAALPVAHLCHDFGKTLFLLGTLAQKFYARGDNSLVFCCCACVLRSHTRTFDYLRWYTGNISPSLLRSYHLKTGGFLVSIRDICLYMRVFLKAVQSVPNGAKVGGVWFVCVPVTQTSANRFNQALKTMLGCAGLCYNALRLRVTPSFPPAQTHWKRTSQPHGIYGPTINRCAQVAHRQKARER